MIRAVLALALAAASLTGCGTGKAEPPFDPDFPEIKCDRTFSYRYKVTVVIDTPDGPRSGSSVNEVTVRRFIADSLTNPCGMRTYGKGEAVPVNLGAKGHVFVLLSGEDYPYWFLDAPMHIVNAQLQEAEPEKVHSYEGALQIARASGRKWDVPKIAQIVPDYFEPMGRSADNMPEHMLAAYAWQGTDMRPYFVRYTNEKDWRTVERIDPDRLEATYGKGYGLRSFTIQVTNEPASKGRMINLLPWSEYGYCKLFIINPEVLKRKDNPNNIDWDMVAYIRRLPHYSTGSLVWGTNVKRCH